MHENPARGRADGRASVAGPSRESGKESHAKAREESVAERFRFRRLPSLSSKAVRDLWENSLSRGVRCNRTDSGRVGARSEKGGGRAEEGVAVFPCMPPQLGTNNLL